MKIFPMRLKFVEFASAISVFISSTIIKVQLDFGPPVLDSFSQTHLSQLAA